MQISGFPAGLEGKASICNAGDPGLIPESERSPGEGNGNPLQYSCREKSHGRRSLGGCSLWGRKESDTTERLHLMQISTVSVTTEKYTFKNICSSIKKNT